MNSHLGEELRKANIPFEQKVPVSSFSYFGTGGLAEFLVKPKSIGEFRELHSILTRLGTPYKVVGATSNLLFLDDAKYTCLVSTKDLVHMNYDEERGELFAECGVMVPDLSRYALRYSLSGFAGMEGIPGTVGGGVFMNAGAYGDSISSVLKRVQVIDEESNLCELSNKELRFSYRDSAIKSGGRKLIVVGAFFEARRGDERSLASKMELVHSKRHKYNEYVYPNLGSAFSGSVYRALAEKDFTYKVVSSLYFLFNYKLKFLRKESPINRRWLNEYTAKKFGIADDGQQYSDKTINTIVNRGQGTEPVVRYLSKIKSLVGDKVPIENEIVDGF